MGVYDEHPPSNKENTKLVEDKPPSEKLLENTRRSLQPDGTDRLSSRSMHGDGIGNGTVSKRAMVYILLAPGAKPHFGYYNDTLLH